jgi:hypothetical protein
MHAIRGYQQETYTLLSSYTSLFMNEEEIIFHVLETDIKLLSYISLTRNLKHPTPIKTR